MASCTYIRICICTCTSTCDNKHTTRHSWRVTCALLRQVKARMQATHEQEQASLRDALRRSDRMRDDDVAAWSREVHALKTQLSEDKAAWDSERASMQRDLDEYADALRRMQEAELQAAVNLDYMCGWATSPNASPQSGWSRDNVVSSTRTSPHSRRFCCIAAPLWRPACRCECAHIS